MSIKIKKIAIIKISNSYNKNNNSNNLIDLRVFNKNNLNCGLIEIMKKGKVYMLYILGPVPKVPKV
jgi:hypothetical protein